MRRIGPEGPEGPAGAVGPVGPEGPVGPSGVLNALVDGTAIPTSDSAAEITYLETTILGANLATGNVIRFALGGSYLTNSGLNPTFRWRVYLGNSLAALVLIYDGATGVHGASANRCAWSMDGHVALQTANLQRVRASYRDNITTAASGTGWGNVGASAYRYTQDIEGIDSVVAHASNLALRVTMTMSAAATTITFRREYATVQVLASVP